MEVLTRTIRQEKKKRHPNQEEVKQLLFADDMISYTENSKDSTKKLLELINNFSKVAEYKIYRQAPTFDGSTYQLDFLMV